MNGSTVAQWKNQLTAARNELEDAIVERNHVEQKISRIRDRMSKLQDLIKKREQRKVTDHAIVQYMKKVMGVDIALLEKTILESGECTTIVKGDTVVTVEKRAKPPTEK